MRIAGVDPGAWGAISLIDNGRLVEVHDMPRLMLRRGKTDKAEVDGYLLGRLLADLRADIAYIEKVGGIMGQSASSSFNFGRAAGAPEYAFKALGVRVETVPPGTWKKTLKLNKGKDAAVARASALWPQMSHHWEERRGNGKREQREGRAESALVAEFGRLANDGGSNVFG